MSSTPPPVHAALFYAAEGLAVFPCANDSKAPHPMLGGIGGLHHATTEPAIVAGWWGRDPRARIGLNLGKSGLIAFDFEGPEKGGDPIACRRAILEHYGPGALPPTWEAASPSGGIHILYLAPHGEVPSTLPITAPGLDRIRSDGGYVVVPSVVAGEVLPDAEGRSWASGPSPFGASVHAAPAPEWLADVAAEVTAARKAAKATARKRGRFSIETTDATAYGEKALQGLWLEVAHAPEGQRHAEITRAAVRAAALEAGGHVSGEKWREVLAHAGGVCGLSEGEVGAVLEWATTTAQVEPAGPAREKGAAA